MGRKKKGSNKKGLSTLKDAVSDNEVDGPAGSDNIYDEVDAWDNEQTTRLAGVVQGRQKREDFATHREMFALSGTDSDSDLELPKITRTKKDKKKSAAQKQIELNDEDFLGSDVEGTGEGTDDPRAWGSKKKHFYGGNTGQGIASSDSEFDEDEAEEKEAEALQQRQLDRMQEEDFLDTFVTKQEHSEKEEEELLTGEENVKRDLTMLTSKQRAALFRQQAPEFDGIVLDFKQKIAVAVQLSRLVGLEDAGKIPPGPVAEFVRAKFQLLINYCTNIAAYLMFKSKGTNLKLHPVTGRLVEYKQLIDSLQSMEKLVQPQIDSLLARLDEGDAIEDIVKEERRREMKKLKKTTGKKKVLKLLQKEKEIDNTLEEKTEKSTTKKRKQPDETADLTRDERLAVELYRAIKRNKNDLDDDNDSEDLPQEDDPKASNGITVNPEVASADNVDLDEGDEKRGITYEIAKNKGLKPKRNRLQRNPRVKHRMKFEKAKKRRKGAIKEVRTETTRYGGEISGINARVRKGVKIK